MNERRINPAFQEKKEDRLKAIAGLIQKLTYREMHKLSELMQQHEVLSEGDGYPEAFLAVARAIFDEENAK